MGGKAAGLEVLERAGLRVPPWALVPDGVFREHLQAAALDGLHAAFVTSATRAVSAPSDSRRAAAEMCAAQLSERLRSAASTPALLTRLATVCAGLAGRVAVRSSMGAEDGLSSSHAGMFDTSLNVRSDEAAEVAQAVLQCWSSAFSTETVRHRLMAGGDPVERRVEVILQSMVDPHWAGVAFSRNPIDGSDTILVSATPGLADELVAGRDDGHTWTIDRDGIEDPDRCVGPLAAGACRELRDLVIDAERALGMPCDVEWASGSDGLWALQLRPMTTEVTLETWDREATTEQWGRVAAPLTADVAARFIQAGQEGYLDALGLCAGPTRDRLVRRALAPIRGRIYMNLSSWGALGSLAAPTLPNPAIARWLGWAEVSPVALRRSAWWVLWIRCVALAPLRERAIRRAVARWISSATEPGALDEILPIFRSAGRIELGRDIVWGQLRDLLERNLGPVRADEMMRLLQLAPVPTRSAAAARDLQRIRRGVPGARASVDAWLRRYGATCIDGLHLDAPTWRERPELLVESLTSSPTRAGRPPIHTAVSSRAFRAAGLRGRTLVTTVALAWLCRRQLRLSEEVRFGRASIVGALRGIVVGIEQRHREPLEPGDIFYATIAELDAVGTDVGDLRVIAAGRRSQADSWRDGPEPAVRLECTGFPPRPTDHPRSVVAPVGTHSPVMHGRGCSPGIVDGTAVLVESAADLANCRGRIAVCRHVPPEWALLLNSCSAVVAELGSPLSHAMIIARELGVPAVAGIPGVFSALAAGDLLHVDGTSGVVLGARPRR